MRHVVLAFVAFGFGLALAGPESPPARPATATAPTAPRGLAKAGVFVDPVKKEIALKGQVVFRGPDILEYFCCSRGTAEHESLISAEADPMALRVALMLPPFRLQPGKPVRWDEDLQPPNGPTILVFLEYQDPKTGKTVRDRAEDWVLMAEKDPKTGKMARRPMRKTGFVFSGGGFYVDPETREQTFLASGDGALITLYHRVSSVLDNPQKEGSGDEIWYANTDVVPPIGTKVTVVLQPAAPPASQPTSRPASTPANPR